MTSLLTSLSRRDLVLGGSLLGLASLIRPAYGHGAAGPAARILEGRPDAMRPAGESPQATSIWSFDGVLPGPIIRARRGEPIRVRFVNNLPQATAVHWHGVRLANAMDGAVHLTQPPVAPGATFDYDFVSPDAGTFWYHAAPRADRTRGLSGLLLIDEPEPVGADQDVALLIDSWRVRPDGSWIDPGGPPGDQEDRTSRRIVTLNGVATLDVPVRANERLRLRLVNATDRLVSFRLDRHRLFVMALDGQPAEPFVARDSRLILGPGNRADLMIDAVLEASATAPATVETEDGARALARLVYAAGSAARPAPLPDPTPFPANPLPARMNFSGAIRQDLPIDRPDTPPRAPSPWRIAEAEAVGRPLLTVKRGRVVMLAFANRREEAVVLHVHGHAMRLLDRLDDGWKPFWLDTIVAPPQQTSRVAFVADNPGRWLIECRGLGGPSAPMWTWFEVT